MPCIYKPISGYSGTTVNGKAVPVAFTSYLQQIISNYFGNSIPYASVFVNSSNLASTGDYPSFAANVHGRNLQYNVSNLSLVKKDILTRVSLTLNISLISPQQQVRQVWVTKAGQSEVSLANNYWSATSTILTISPDSGVEYGDNIRYLYW